MTAFFAVGCSSDDENDTPVKQKYSVAIASGITNGSVSANPTSAEAGATITLTATANTGYEFDSYSVVDSSSKSISVSENTFTMPESNVTVSATFKGVEWNYDTFRIMKNNDVKDGIIFTTTDKSSANLYLGTHSFSVPEGYSITRIEFATTYLDLAGVNSGNVTDEDYTFYSNKDKKQVAGKKVIWTGNSQSVTFNCKAYAVEYVKFTIAAQ